MDAEALAAVRHEEWARLQELAKTSRLTGAQADELVTRYRAASADLAQIQTSMGRTPESDHVSALLSRARLRLSGVRENILRQVPRFFLLQLPAALYRVRWMTAAVAAGFILIGFVVGIWVSSNSDVIATLAPAADLQYYAENSFVDYYSENPAAEFAGQVWTNNAWIAAQCVLFGVTGLWPVYVLVSNAVGVGIAGAVMAYFDRADVFFQFILPHGLLELTSIFVAGAAGLQMFWAWVVPGRQTRGHALAVAGRSLATIAIGLILSLFLSGLIEGFITRQNWPWQIKVGIGAVALAVFLVYMLGLGRWAYRQGETGDMTEYEVGTPRLVAG